MKTKILMLIAVILTLDQAKALQGPLLQTKTRMQCENGELTGSGCDYLMALKLKTGPQPQR